jgi:ubiquinone/menaquinone biosynthesis C-methylase UbiE
MSLLKLARNSIRKFFNPTLQVADYYEEWTERYVLGFGDIFQSKQAKNDEQLISYYIDQMGIRDGMRLLDAGCGVCGPAVKIAQSKDVVIDAYTLSLKQLEIAEKKVHEEGLKNQVNPRLGDFHHFNSVPDNHYDIVYFMESLVHSSKPKSALIEAKRILKPDGVLYIKDLFEKTPYSVNEISAIKRWVKHNNKYLALNITKKENILKIARDLGFQLEFCQLMKIETNQDKGNKFVVDFNIMPDPIKNSLPPYLEWYEIKLIKPGPGIVFKM